MSISRYDLNDPLSLTAKDGRKVQYLRRRFIPPAERQTVSSRVTLSPGQRADIVAAQTLGDPELSWLLADANDVRRPSDLEFLGRPIVIPVPGFGGPRGL
jgi:hypothetical protein